MPLQFKLTWDLESKLLDNTPVTVASLLFIPRGIKAICVVSSGAKSIIPIFLAHFITDIVIGMGAIGGVLSGSASVISMMLPLMMANFLSQKPLFSPLAKGTTENFSLFRLVIFTEVMSSLLNSMIGAIRYQTDPLDPVTFRFFSGDVGSNLAVLGLLLLVKRPIMQVASAIERRH